MYIVKVVLHFDPLFLGPLVSGAAATWQSQMAVNIPKQRFVAVTWLQKAEV